MQQLLQSRCCHVWQQGWDEAAALSSHLLLRHCSPAGRWLCALAHHLAAWLGRQTWRGAGGCLSLQLQSPQLQQRHPRNRTLASAASLLPPHTLPTVNILRWPCCRPIAVPPCRPWKSACGRLSLHWGTCCGVVGAAIQPMAFEQPRVPLTLYLRLVVITAA